VEGRIVIQPRVSRETYVRFKSLAHAHGVTVERALEELMRSALQRAGITERIDVHVDLAK
jgi:hypothetical protein